VASLSGPLPMLAAHALRELLKSPQHTAVRGRMLVMFAQPRVSKNRVCIRTKYLVTSLPIPARNDVYTPYMVLVNHSSAPKRVCLFVRCKSSSVIACVDQTRFFVANIVRQFAKIVRRKSSSVIACVDQAFYVVAKNVASYSCVACL
jgi:hypothetical protein